MHKSVLVDRTIFCSVDLFYVNSGKNAKTNDRFQFYQLESVLIEF